MPKVSIIVPTYDDADTLSSTIESVKNQTFEDWELIVVDDASPDCTEQIVYSFDDDRIRYFSHKSNEGASAARNTGIKHADGNYVALLDSDDIWKEQKLQRQIREIERLCSAWGAIYCGVKTSGGWSQLFKSKIAKLLSGGATQVRGGGKELISDILMMELIGNWGSTLIIEKQIVDRINGFDEDFSRYQDLEFVIRLLRETKMAYIEEDLAIINKSGLANPEAKEKGMRELFRKFEQDIKKLGVEGYSVQKIHNLSLGKRYLHYGQFRIGMKYILRSRLTSVTDVLGVLWAFVSGVKYEVSKKLSI